MKVAAGAQLPGDEQQAHFPMRAPTARKLFPNGAALPPSPLHIRKTPMVSGDISVEMYVYVSVDVPFF